MDGNKLCTTVELCFCTNPALLVCCIVLFFLVHSNSVECLTEDSRTLKKYGVADSEICVIANVCPDTTDEVFALVPSLKCRNRGYSAERMPLPGE
ncbi:DNA-directed RNA polymerases IV and V subunit 4, partial [Cucurbita argyrosperma subsp. argyrosperma]